MIEITYLTMTCGECECEWDMDFEPEIDAKTGDVIFRGVRQRFKERGLEDVGGADEWCFKCAECRGSEG
jgi:hypothetical protein